MASSGSPQVAEGRPAGVSPKRRAVSLEIKIEKLLESLLAKHKSEDQARVDEMEQRVGLLETIVTRDSQRRVSQDEIKVMNRKNDALGARISSIDASWRKALADLERRVQGDVSDQLQASEARAHHFVDQLSATVTDSESSRRRFEMESKLNAKEAEASLKMLVLDAAKELENMVSSARLETEKMVEPLKFRNEETDERIAVITNELKVIQDDLNEKIVLVGGSVSEEIKEMSQAITGQFKKQGETISEVQGGLAHSASERSRIESELAKLRKECDGLLNSANGLVADLERKTLQQHTLNTRQIVNHSERMSQVEDEAAKFKELPEKVFGFEKSLKTSNEKQDSLRSELSALQLAADNHEKNVNGQLKTLTKKLDEQQTYHSDHAGKLMEEAGEKLSSTISTFETEATGLRKRLGDLETKVEEHGQNMAESVAKITADVMISQKESEELGVQVKTNAQEVEIIRRKTDTLNHDMIRSKEASARKVEKAMESVTSRISADLGTIKSVKQNVESSFKMFEETLREKSSSLGRATEDFRNDKAEFDKRFEELKAETAKNVAQELVAFAEENKNSGRSMKIECAREIQSLVAPLTADLDSLQVSVKQNYQELDSKFAGLANELSSNFEVQVKDNRGIRDSITQVRASVDLERGARRDDLEKLRKSNAVTFSEISTDLKQQEELLSTLSDASRNTVHELRKEIDTALGTESSSRIKTIQDMRRSIERNEKAIKDAVVGSDRNKMSVLDILHQREQYLNKRIDSSAEESKDAVSQVQVKVENLSQSMTKNTDSLGSKSKELYDQLKKKISEVRGDMADLNVTKVARDCQSSTRRLEEAIETDRTRITDLGARVDRNARDVQSQIERTVGQVSVLAEQWHVLDGERKKSATEQVSSLDEVRRQADQARVEVQVYLEGLIKATSKELTARLEQVMNEVDENRSTLSRSMSDGFNKCQNDSESLRLSLGKKVSDVEKALNKAQSQLLISKTELEMVVNSGSEMAAQELTSAQAVIAQSQMQMAKKLEAEIAQLKLGVAGVKGEIVQAAGVFAEQITASQADLEKADNDIAAKLGEAVTHMSRKSDQLNGEIVSLQKENVATNSIISRISDDIAATANVVARKEAELGGKIEHSASHGQSQLEEVARFFTAQSEALQEKVREADKNLQKKVEEVSEKLVQAHQHQRDEFETEVGRLREATTASLDVLLERLDDAQKISLPALDSRLNDMEEQVQLFEKEHSKIMQTLKDTDRQLEEAEERAENYKHERSEMADKVRTLSDYVTDLKAESRTQKRRGELSRDALKQSQETVTALEQKILQIKKKDWYKCRHPEDPVDVAVYKTLSTLDIPMKIEVQRLGPGSYMLDKKIQLVLTRAGQLHVRTGGGYTMFSDYVTDMISRKRLASPVSSRTRGTTGSPRRSPGSEKGHWV